MIGKKSKAKAVRFASSSTQKVLPPRAIETVEKIQSVAASTDTFDFGEGERRRWLVDCIGLGKPEHWGRWTEGKEAGFTLKPPQKTSPERLVLHASAYVSAEYPRLDVRVYVNNIHSADWQFDYPGLGFGTPRELIIPAKARTKNSVLKIKMHVKDPRSPAEIVGSSDTRRLGLALKSLSLG